MSAKNQVIAGDYNGKIVKAFNGEVSIVEPWSYKLIAMINKSTIQSYQLVDENYRKSATSAVGRAAIGGLLLGPVGLLAGLSAKNKGTHVIVASFKNGKKSLLEIDDRIYKALMTVLF